jgi:histidine triad (HIT) family protein
MTHADCIFCKIIEKKIPSEVVYEDENVIGFRDLHPQAKLHYLFIHRNHTKNVNEMSKNGKELQDVFVAIKDYTETEQLDASGFRIVTNLGPHAGQTVFHTHFHVLAGEQLGTFGR